MSSRAPCSHWKRPGLWPKPGTGIASIRSFAVGGLIRRKRYSTTSDCARRFGHCPQRPENAPDSGAPRIGPAMRSAGVEGRRLCVSEMHLRAETDECWDTPAMYRWSLGADTTTSVNPRFPRCRREPTGSRRSLQTVLLRRRFLTSGLDVNPPGGNRPKIGGNPTFLFAYPGNSLFPNRFDRAVAHPWSCIRDLGRGRAQIDADGEGTWTNNGSTRSRA